ncbi:hypothetical protein BAUCODRAFT_339427 [Baudoinia panamericana UAMH 10762]|uniref:Mediator of RNA polymerase II transcription subunit 13 n=1 Tax=Baudoinia panamericana (strain UAMH 10762) TaxID=717646 RepID=M2NK78_BAUPA|nr:uncharacterized protein BAUCODRAFT_339427 [Baudoinia panamericana UAMH 10762]EMC99515.1 hypothetical protein BAUCODRAFT_339427 [Baudoinia panamericana UAMH 10762]
MDFFKSCKTNVQRIDELWKTTFTKYNWAGEQQNLEELVLELHEQGVLCAAVSLELWLFGLPGAQRTNSARNEGLQFHEFGTLEDSPGLCAADGSSVRGVLLAAIEVAIAARLARTQLTLRVGPWTWLLRHRSDAEFAEGCCLVLRIETRLTDLGSLYITTTTRPTRLATLSGRDPVNAALLIAPGGQIVSLTSAASASATLLDGARWHEIVTAGLRRDGLSVASGERWVRVQTAPLEDTFTWPESLCFVMLNSPSQAPELTPHDWRHYFDRFEEDDGFKHPLAVAEDWFNAAEDQGVPGVDNPPQTTTGVEGAAALNENLIAENALVTSPPFNQRTADQQAAMSGIYPTPPDGFLPGQASQQPVSDPVTANISHGDMEAVATDLQMTSVEQQHERRQQTSSTDLSSVHRHASDDLFGDMGGEMDFGGDEVGDADFDFFNEDGNDADDRQAGSETHAEGVPVEHMREDTSPIAANPNFPMDAESYALNVEQPSTDTEASAAGSGATPGGNVEAHSFTAEPVQPHAGRDALVGRPLSPFGIKERLLPPPVPASMQFNTPLQRSGLRRSGIFDPMPFKESLELGGPFASQYGRVASGRDYVIKQRSQFDITLPPRRKRSDLNLRAEAATDSSDEYSDSDSENDLYESASSVSDENLPPKAPWSTKKRKREDYEAVLSDGTVTAGLDWTLRQAGPAAASGEVMRSMLDRLVGARAGADVWLSSSRMDSTVPDDMLPPIQDVLQLTKMDLIYTAQLVSEQAVSCSPSIVRSLDILPTDHKRELAVQSAVREVTEETIRDLVTGIAPCEIAEIALIREPLNKNMPAASNPRPGQPRPPQRANTTELGPDIAAILPPYVRVQRGNDAYEMLPPALDFWETLSLAPVNGQKDVRAYCIFPLNEDLQRLAEGFIADLGTAYEGCKLGTHAHIRNVSEENELDDYEDGLAPVELTDDDTLVGAIKAYAAVSVNLGKFLASVASLETDRTIVVYLINPFQHPRAARYICACFWLLCKAYRDNVPKNQRSQQQSDVAFQLLPIELIACPDGMVMLDAKQLANIAREVYDRCPPTTNSGAEAKAALPNYAAPFVELACPPPKRIGFQLVAEPPGDLLHEGSALHLAYAVSADGKWMTVAWTDSSGRNQSNSSFCLCGRTFANVLVDIWERTRGIMAAREATWRVFVVTDGPIDDSISRCWRQTVQSPRKQAFSVTLLSAKLDMGLQLTPHFLTTGDTTGTVAATTTGFLTPGSTPQAALTTVSPEAATHAAPPTPAPSDAAVASAEPDPDAHFVDLADETWAVVFSQPNFLPSSPVSTTPTPSVNGLAQGALFKRGEAGLDGVGVPGDHLPSLGVTLLWTVQVRPSGSVDEGGAKQAEMALREMLKLYRHLSVLTRARGLGDDGVGGSGDGNGNADACVPFHLVAARRGAAALDGLYG